MQESNGKRVSERDEERVETRLKGVNLFALIRERKQVLAQLYWERTNMNPTTESSERFHSGVEKFQDFSFTTSARGQ